jgi:hypothetical protein
MKITKLFTIFILFLACGCSSFNSTPKSTQKSGNPDWVSKRVTQFQNAPVGNPPQSIWKYEYQGKTVYYIPPQCCDQMSQLYDASGKMVCAPDGGFSGRGDSKCPDFLQVRKNGVLIWRDTRSK